MADVLMAQLSKTTQSAVSAEATQRAQNKATVLSQQKTANKKELDSTAQKKKKLVEQDIEVTQRTTTTIPASGLHPGTKRDDEKDQSNQSNLRDIELAEEKLARDQRNDVVVTKRQADTTRARQKLQMRCNHQYDVTKRCVLCNKHRDSHRYDV